MVELSKVAELVDDHVVGKMRRKKCEPVVEVEIAVFGTASPTRLLIFDEDTLIRETIRSIERDEPLMDTHPRRFLVREIVLRRLSPSSFSPSEPHVHECIVFYHMTLPL